LFHKQKLVIDDGKDRLYHWENSQSQEIYLMETDRLGILSKKRNFFTGDSLLGGTAYRTLKPFHPSRPQDETLRSIFKKLEAL
jgi:hypothetical protein